MSDPKATEIMQVSQNDSGSSRPSGTIPHQRSTHKKGLWGTVREQKNLIWPILIASGGGFLFGNDIGYIGPILTFDSFQETMSNSEPINAGEEALIVGTFSIGAILGALPFISALFVERIGRKWSIFIGCLIFLLGAIVQAASTNLPTFYVGRVIDGFSIGILSVVVPIYQAEVAPPHVRGAMGTMYQLSLTFGILVANLCDWAVENDPNWWLAMIPQIVFSAVLAVLALFIPYSPRFQLMKGDNKGAADSLQSLRSGAPKEDIDEEFAAMSRTVQEEAKLGVASYREIFTSSFMVKFLCVGIMVQLFQQFTGINALMYFGPTIFKSAGVDAIVFQILQASVNFISTLPALYAVDRFGRCRLFTIGAIGMTVCFAVVGAMGAGSLDFPEQCFSDTFRTDNRVACAFTNGFQPEPCIPDAEAFGREEFTDLCALTEDPPGSGNFIPGYTPEQCSCGANVADWFTVVMVLFTFVFIFFFASSWGPVAWVYTAEIYPARFRAKVVGIATMANWVGNAGVAFATPVLLDEIQFYTFIIFACVLFVMIFFSLWLPETKDLPLENIVDKFEAKLGVWKEKNADDLKEVEM